LDAWFASPSERLAWELGLPASALVASLIAFTWGRRGRRLPLAVRLRSPIEVTWTGGRRAGADRARRPIVATAARAKAVAPATTTSGPAIAAAPWTTDRPRPRSPIAELRALTWQTMREGRATWLFLAAIGLIWAAPLLDGRVHIDPTYLFFWQAMIALTAGVSVFGLENGRRTYRFLVHHGARPGLVWRAKLSAWC